jgi:hypothetical protein
VSDESVKPSQRISLVCEIRCTFTDERWNQNSGFQVLSVKIFAQGVAHAGLVGAQDQGWGKDRAPEKGWDGHAELKSESACIAALKKIFGQPESCCQNSATAGLEYPLRQPGHVGFVAKASKGLTQIEEKFQAIELMAGAGMDGSKEQATFVAQGATIVQQIIQRCAYGFL